ncbi:MULTISPECIES: TetR/AcrR family transcriptional regulator [Pseudonocardia]|uniref:AcrR family transcriptional regulator n=1 Tax=Pseudonocardia alni TaxID=33907 RepID=A0A852W973_PSEA5|nr:MULTISPECIES: TetR/AcrR family transcriptional regulator [Pseudonocardia]MCO7193074.1 TetR/AcrR family transcriptional regulator [Pseudonocardia sp. McavD-2-B]NYG03881.1 AcrR family transcriptional regulator [Pseudonocardia antarctica]
MTGFVDPVTPRNGGAVAVPDVVAAEDTTRMERVLDAAAELLVRRGYRGVTVEDVAHRAGVGKGTVYLHVRTKEALFLTVLLRSQRRLFADLADRMLVEPVVALPWGMSRELYERLRADEVARALYLGDGEVLGRLAHEAAGTLGELGRRRDTVVREHFRVLRSAGLVDDALSPDEQIHAWGALTWGYLFTESAASPFAPTDPRRTAELIEHGVARLLTGPAPVARASEVAAAVAGLYRPLVEHIDAEWRRRVR